MVSRRDFTKTVLASSPLATGLLLHAQKTQRIPSIAGVKFGTQTYSFRDKPLDGILQAMVECGFSECEVFSPHIEPGAAGVAREAAREALRKWRLTVSEAEIKAIRKKFDDAGAGVYALNLSFNDSFTDEEIDRGFWIAKTFGAEIITASSTLTSAKRVAPFAESHQMTVAFHGHSDVKNPNEFCTPDSFATAMGMSKRFGVNLDIGHFTAANFDAVDYIKKHHDRIYVLHLKDRKRDQGPNVPWGEGDTPIKPVLQLLKKEKYPMRAYVEYEYRGAADSVTEVKKCIQYCKDTLA